MKSHFIKFSFTIHVTFRREIIIKNSHYLRFIDNSYSFIIHVFFNWSFLSHRKFIFIHYKIIIKLIFHHDSSLFYIYYVKSFFNCRKFCCFFLLKSITRSHQDFALIFFFFTYFFCFMRQFCNSHQHWRIFIKFWVSN